MPSLLWLLTVYKIAMTHVVPMERWLSVSLNLTSVVLLELPSLTGLALVTVRCDCGLWQV